MPRILFIVDEFQEFFVNDDKLAHEASLLLDRLVRQGRAFGMHVILGSQTLAGAYSLARSTIGQMAVRIALQCSASDAHLILSEDNSAARLLGRPGEAIYNDANGLLEGNHPFQVVWLPDEERNQCLEKIAQQARSARREHAVPIVFEGQAAADLRSNHELTRLLETAPSPESKRASRLWLGAPISIKEPTSVVFRRQSGNNLLVVGANRDLAAGMTCSAMVSVLSTLTPAVELSIDAPSAGRPHIVVLDGTTDDETNALLPEGLASLVKQAGSLGTSSSCETQIQEVFQEVTRRSETNQVTLDAVYMVIFDLARFRRLQSADDYGLGSFGSSASDTPAAQLAHILREGPNVGVHTLIWADGYHTVTRWLERSVLREFGQRILMQMSATDSSHLMDSAIAAHLGPNRALLYDHDRGTAERFRPYAVPDDAWLGEFATELAAREHAAPASN